MTEASMTADGERNLGTQPLESVMAELGLKAHALVEASAEQMTHKMVARAIKGRRLTPNTKAKVIRALNAAAGKEFTSEQLFNY